MAGRLGSDLGHGPGQSWIDGPGRPGGSEQQFSCKARGGNGFAGEWLFKKMALQENGFAGPVNRAKRAEVGIGIDPEHAYDWHRPEAWGWNRPQHGIGTDPWHAYD